MSLYLRGDSQGYRSLYPQPKRIEEEDRTGCHCTLRAIGLLTKENRKEGQDRLSLHSRGVSRGNRSLDPQPKRIEKKDRTGCHCTHGVTLKAIQVL